MSETTKARWGSCRTRSWCSQGPQGMGEVGSPPEGPTGLLNLRGKSPVSWNAQATEWTLVFKKNKLPQKGVVLWKHWMFIRYRAKQARQMENLGGKVNTQNYPSSLNWWFGKKTQKNNKKKHSQKKMECGFICLFTRRKVCPCPACYGSHQAGPGWAGPAGAGTCRGRKDRQGTEGHLT